MKERTEEEIDILKEIGNIGGGNALTSLSMMLGYPLDLEVPICNIVNRENAGELLRNPSSLYAGVSMTMAGTVDCMLVLLMNKEFSKLVINTLDAEEPVFDVNSLTEMQKSALCEVGNIIGNSYITALGSLLDLRIDVSVPKIAVDTGHRVLETFLKEHAARFERLLFVSSSFKANDVMLESNMMLCPTDSTLAAIFDKLS